MLGCRMEGVKESCYDLGLAALLEFFGTSGASVKVDRHRSCLSSFPVGPPGGVMGSWQKGS